VLTWTATGAGACATGAVTRMAAPQSTTPATGIKAGARTHHQDSVMAPASLAMDSTRAGHGRQAKLLSAF
jgi:hypothetical protein